MTADQRLLALAFVISATAYLAGCLVGGIVLHQPSVTRFALTALAANSISYLFQFAGWRGAAIVPSTVAWSMGAAAGIFLVINL